MFSRQETMVTVEALLGTIVLSSGDALTLTMIHSTLLRFLVL